MADVIEARAKFVYEGARLAAEAAGAPVVPAPWEDRDAEFQNQFLDIIRQETSDQRISAPKELHDSWVRAYTDMGWQYGPEYDPENKIHPDMVPFYELDPLEQDKDHVFIALCDIARQWIRDEEQEDTDGDV